MTYWQILKQRRQSLKLSIDEVAFQTRLTPEYIQAIEDNRLAVFKDEFGYVRYHIQTYAGAIGVNFQAIAPEVDANLDSYARRKNIQVNVKKSSSAKKTSSGQKKKTSSARKKSRKKKPASRKRTSQASRKRTNKNSARARQKARAARIRKRRLARAFALLGLVGLMGMIGLNFWMEQRDEKAARLAEEARQLELKKKEEETAKLAEQKKQGATGTKKEETEDKLDIQASKDGTNTFLISNALDETSSLTIDAVLPEESTVELYKDDVLISGDSDEKYSKEYSATIHISQPCTITLVIGSYDKGEITVNSQKIPFDDTYWSQGEPATFIFNIEGSSQTQSSQSDEEDKDTNDDGMYYEEDEEENVFSGNYDYSGNGSQE